MLLFVFGLLIVYDPFARANDITLLIGIFTRMLGSLALFDSFQFRNRKETLDMMF